MSRDIQERNKPLRLAKTGRSLLPVVVGHANNSSFDHAITGPIFSNGRVSDSLWTLSISRLDVFNVSTHFSSRIVERYLVGKRTASTYPLYHRNRYFLLNCYHASVMYRVQRRSKLDQSPHLSADHVALTLISRFQSESGPSSVTIATTLKPFFSLKSSLLRGEESPLTEGAISISLRSCHDTQIFSWARRMHVLSLVCVGMWQIGT